MRATEFITEGWSKQYKSSINCSHPKGFSQKAHCAGKKKHNESVETEMVCEDCGMCQTHGNLNEIKKGAKDSNGFTKCWPGKHAEGTKKGKNGGQVRNCKPNESIEANRADENIASMPVPSGDPILNDPNLYQLLEHYLGSSFIQWASEMSPYTPRNSYFDTIKVNGIKPFYNKVASQVKALAAEPVPNIDSIIGIVFTIPGLVSAVDKQRILTRIKQQQAADEKTGWVWKGSGTQIAQTNTTNEDWNKVNKRDKTDGLSQKAVNAYRRENPGSKLKTAVTTKPSKLKAGSKDAKRRKSFCARMSGNKGPMKKPNGKPTPKALALRRWNCESVEEMVDMIIENMDHAKDNQAVPELKAALLAKKTTLQNASEDQVYDIIDKMMTRIAKSHGMSGQKLHDMWVKEYDQIPDTWIMK